MEYSSSLVWRLALVFIIAVFLVVISGKSALKVLAKNIAPVAEPGTPWGLDCALILFLLYAILFPAVSLKITSFVIPDLNLDKDASLQTQTDQLEPKEASMTSFNDAEVDLKDNSPSVNRSVATQHPMARLLIRSYGTSQFTTILLFFFLTVVCVAPLTEEFIFRVVMQSAFEKTIVHNNQEDIINNSDVDILSKWKSVVVVGLPAFIFALLHVGTVESSNTPTSCNLLFQATVGSLVSNLITLITGVTLLSRFFGAKSRDFGCKCFRTIKPRDVVSALPEFVKEFYCGAVLYLIVAPIISGVNLLMQKIFPNMIVAPVPIFIFALWNGYIYYKTRQYAVCVGSHIALNFTSFIFLYLNVKAHTFGFF